MNIREHHKADGVARSSSIAVVALVSTLVATLLSALLVTGSTAAVATGSGESGQRVEVTINIPALPLTNECNGDIINLSGDMRIVTVTRPTRNGGYTVSSTATASNLRGQRIAPLPAIRYVGQQSENSYSYYAPPPYPSSTRILHWTKLVPLGRAPVMWLVIVMQYTIAADGALVPVAERAYLSCSKPRSHRHH